MCGRLLCLLCLLQATLVWSLPVRASTEQATDPKGFQLETDPEYCIANKLKEKVSLSCTYTGRDYDIMTVSWYRARKTTGCCAVDATDHAYWGVSVSLRTLRNHTAQSVTIQLIIDQFSSEFGGLYFCEAFNPLYPSTAIQSEHITELISPGELESPHLENCSGGQRTSQCSVPVPSFEVHTLCTPSDVIILPCKRQRLQSITLLKYNSVDGSVSFQLKWTKPVMPCEGYMWRARICQSDALTTQSGFTETSDSNNIQCNAPWDYWLSPDGEYLQFSNLQKNMQYVFQAESVHKDNTSDRTVFTSPSMFVGHYMRPTIEYCPTTITASRGVPVTLQCVVTGDPKPMVKFLQFLQPVATTDARLSGGGSPQSPSDAFDWVHNEIHGPWIHNLTISPQQNGTYACQATSSINKGWGVQQEQVEKWINVIINEDK